MKAYREKDSRGRPIWRVKYSVARRRVRKTFHSLEDANEWIVNNRTIAIDEGRIFWETWNGIEPKERHEILDALSLLREFRAKHPTSNMTMVNSVRNEITKVEAIETSITLHAAIDLFLESKLNNKRKGSVSPDW
jgi:hypothetical protein